MFAVDIDDSRIIGIVFLLISILMRNFSWMIRRFFLVKYMWGGSSYAIGLKALHY